MTEVSSLQAALDAANKDSSSNKNILEKKKSAKKKEVEVLRVKKSSRQDTVLIGGHFSKSVSKQLKFIAVEEDMTNQQLLEEALDLLFIKKGKKKVADL